MSNANGFFSFSELKVGRYGIAIDESTLGDSLHIQLMESVVTVVAGGTANADVSVGYNQVNVAALKTLPLGRRVILKGVALNAWSAFGDATLHVADSTGVIQAVRVAPENVQAGDSVRLLGNVVSSNGQVTLGDATVFKIPGAPPVVRTPDTLTTARAVTADDGRLANDLVHIDSASIVNIQPLAGGDVVLNVDDGSGLLRVVLSAPGGFGSLTNVVPGALLDATGLLVRRETGEWDLKPRSVADVNVRFQRVTIAQARTLAAGRLVQIEGLALNSWVTFGDATVHIVDPTGALRTTEVASASLFAGDSVRFIGRIAMRDGQPVLSQVSPTVLLTNRTLPDPVVLTTAQVRTAQSGARDAALVRIQNAIIADTATVITNNAFVVGVNDGSGRSEILIAPALGLTRSQFVVGRTINATGLLVPVSGGGEWQLRPRGQSDLTITQ